MATLYSTPLYFVTVANQPASQAVLAQLSDAMDKLEPGLSTTRKFITATTPALLHESFLKDIAANITVLLIDVPKGIKYYKPLHLTQKNISLPIWAQPLVVQWFIKINTKQASNEKIIRNCAQQTAAWFCRNIKVAVPGLSYPWGPVPLSERNIFMQNLASSSDA